MNVLGLCSYPVESAATRYRLVQFVEPLKQKGIELAFSPFLNSDQFRQFYRKDNLLRKLSGVVPPIAERISGTLKVRNFDLIFIQREAMFFGPGIFESIYQKIGSVPSILDLDDATYVRYISPTYGRFGSLFKFFGKTDNLIKRADTVICGNRFIAEYVEEKGTKAVIIPTVVDTDKFCPVDKSNDIPVIGWIGTHSTFPFLASLFPVLEKLARKHKFALKIVGAGQDKIEIEGVRIENLKWNLERELSDFQSFDIGLYPIKVGGSATKDWVAGKSGFKAIQYMAVGIPFVMTPIGVNAEIGEPGVTHFSASGEEDWYNALDKLLTDKNLAKEMGENARAHSLANYKVSAQADILAETMLECVGVGRS